LQPFPINLWGFVFDLIQINHCYRLQRASGSWSQWYSFMDTDSLSGVL